MSVSSSSLYHTAETSSIKSRGQAASVKDAVMGIGFNVLCKNPALASNESKQVRFKLEKISNSSSLYTIIKINNKSYRISVQQQKQNLSYAKEDWEKIANKVEDLVVLTSSNGDLLKGTLKLKDRTWTPVFRTKNPQPEVKESSIQSIIKDIKLLFEQEIKPLKPLTKSTHSLKEADMEYSSSSLKGENLSEITTEQKTHSEPFYKTFLQKVYNCTLSKILKSPSSVRKTGDLKEPLLEEKERKESFYRNPLEIIRGLFSSTKKTEKQEEIDLEEAVNWKNQMKDYIFPSKDPDTLSQFDLSSDITSSVEGCLSSDILGDDITKGFTLPNIDPDKKN